MPVHAHFENNNIIISVTIKLKCMAFCISIYVIYINSKYVSLWYLNTSHFDVYKLVFGSIQ